MVVCLAPLFLASCRNAEPSSETPNRTPNSEELAAHDAKVICWSSAGYDLRCMTFDMVQEIAEILYGAEQGEIVAGRLERLTDRGEEVTVGCAFDGAWNGVDFGEGQLDSLLQVLQTSGLTINTLEDRLKESYQDELLSHCRTNLDSWLGNEFGSTALVGLPSTSNTSYGRAVARTKELINAGLDEGCQASPADSVMAVWAPFQMAFYFYKAASSVEQAKQGAGDAFDGKDPQQPMKDWLGADTPYGQQYKNALKAMCANGDQVACDRLAGLEGRQPTGEPPEAPDPTGEAPDPTGEAPDPTGESPAPTGEASDDSTGSQCAEDTTCGSNCEAGKLWWQNFLAECDRKSWSTYDCKSLVATTNNCVDPATITPLPEGDWNCSPPPTEAELQQQALLFACEEAQGVAHPGPDGQYYTCSSRLAPADLSEDGFQLYMQEQCLYMYSDSGLCSSGIPSGEPMQPDPVCDVIFPECGGPMPFPEE